mmetsp:Transcript_57045/g.123958  ORF Transcript_57045/g.123958 Transcript_57045/m.123958 type:complete len:247 (+) Transcript_57045:181-921(+)
METAEALAACAAAASTPTRSPRLDETSSMCAARVRSEKVRTASYESMSQYAARLRLNRSKCTVSPNGPLSSARRTKAEHCISSGCIWCGERMGRSSNRSGWLHTLRSCMSTFMIPSIEPDARVPLVSVEAMKSSYKSRCRLESGHGTTCSTLPGNDFSTSFLSRRRRKGRRMVCSRSITSWFTVSVPSIMPETGFENQSLNSLCDSKMCGMRKWRRDHSSIRLFCSGVPVSSSRRFELKLRSVCQR